ncbi:MAG: hypothetical protein FIB01_00015 [Gemmatimonadetes bacterium]|nr:hypothetical protein [Gemmatimonadota bacterium]
MRVLAVAGILCGWALGAAAQQPVPRTAADSSRARQIADSLAIVRELEAATAAQPAGGTAQRLLPDLSAVGDLLADLSPDRSTQEDGDRLLVREVELGLQAAVDPYFRGVVYLGFSDSEGAAIEQAFLTTTSLPWSLQLRLGRYLLPFGKQNATHRHDLHTFEYPYALQRFLGEEGLKGTGIEASRIAAPFGFFQELIVTVVNQLGEPGPDLVTSAPASDRLGGLGYAARLRNYWDLDAATNIELSVSAGTGKLAVRLDRSVGGLNATNARRSLAGMDLTLRWRPLQQGLYRSFLLQAEVLRVLNERRLDLPADLADAQSELPQRDYTGAYLFARWQLTRRGFLGGRVDWLQDPELLAPAGSVGTLRAGSLYYEFFPSEFSKLVAGFERRVPDGGTAVNRVLAQVTFALGPHRPHPF